MNLLTIRNGNTPYVVQNERYASSGDFVVLFFATESVVSVISPFLQLYRQRKMAARFFYHGDHLAKVVLSGTPLLRPAKAPRIDIFFCIATKKRSISLQFKTNRRSRPSLPAFVCRMRTFKVSDLHRECPQHIFSTLFIQIFQTL